VKPAAEEAILDGGLAKYELELVISYAAPLCWEVRDQGVKTRNGTVFFLDVGSGPMAITAAHVIEGWREDRRGKDAGPLHIAGNGAAIRLDEVEQRLIDADGEIDIATFRLSTSEVQQLKKQVLSGHQKAWPPQPPDVDGEISYCGYPAMGTRGPSPPSPLAPHARWGSPRA
jgi:hypothetical protein